MKRIKNLSEDIKNTFEQVWEIVFANRSELLGDRQIAEHFFIAGYEAAIAERAKFDVMNIDGKVYVTSSDGKVFVLQGRPEQWRSLPDLPQD